MADTYDIDQYHMNTTTVIDESDKRCLLLTLIMTMSPSLQVTSLLEAHSSELSLKYCGVGW